MRWMLMMVLATACGASSESGPPAREITSADLKTRPTRAPLVDARLMSPRRIAGTIDVVPDSDVQTAVWGTGESLRGAFEFCIDTSGRVTEIRIVQTTRAPSYDQKIIRTIDHWAFRPVIVDGNAIPVCTVQAFIFTLH